MLIANERFNARYNPRDEKADPIADLAFKCRQAATRNAYGDPCLYEDLLQTAYETVLVCAKRFEPSKAGGDTYRHFFNYTAAAIDHNVRDTAIRFGSKPKPIFEQTADMRSGRTPEQDAVKKPKKRGKRRVEFISDEVLDLHHDPSPTPEAALEIKNREEKIKALLKIALDALDERLRFLVVTRFGLETGAPIDGAALVARYEARFGEKPTKLNTMYKRAFRKMRAALERAGYAAKSEEIAELFGIRTRRDSVRNRTRRS
jgi:hypothetical protein